MEREGRTAIDYLMGVLFPTVEFLRLEDICTHSPGPKGCLYSPHNPKVRLMRICCLWGGILCVQRLSLIHICTTNAQRLKDICTGIDVELTREEWYELYRAQLRDEGKSDLSSSVSKQKK